MGDIPGTRIETKHTSLHAAATATEQRVLFVAPYDITLTSVGFAVDVAVTGTDTNYTSLELIDGGSAGAGTTEIGNLDLASGTDLAAVTASEVLGVAGAGTDANLDSGDYLLVQYTKVANGLLVGAGSWIITFRPQ